MADRYDYARALPAKRSELKEKFGDEERELFSGMYTAGHIDDYKDKNAEFHVKLSPAGKRALDAANNPSYTEPGNEHWWFK